MRVNLGSCVLEEIVGNFLNNFGPEEEEAGTDGKIIWLFEC